MSRKIYILKIEDNYRAFTNKKAAFEGITQELGKELTVDKYKGIFNYSRICQLDRGKWVDAETGEEKPLRQIAVIRNKRGKTASVFRFQLKIEKGEVNLSDLLDKITAN